MRTVLIKDRTFGGDNLNEVALQFEATEITVKELIERRVKREVEIYNSMADKPYSGLVIPDQMEKLLNRGGKVKDRRKVDFEKQCYQALAGFLNSQFFVIINDKQVESLEQKVQVETIQEVEFIKLTPLVGG